MLEDFTEVSNVQERSTKVILSFFIVTHTLFNALKCLKLQKKDNSLGFDCEKWIIKIQKA